MKPGLIRFAISCCACCISCSAIAQDATDTPASRISTYSATLRDAYTAFRPIIDRDDATVASVNLGIARDDTTLLVFDRPVEGWRLSQRRANALDIGDAKLRCVIDLSEHDIKDLYVELQSALGSGQHEEVARIDHVYYTHNRQSLRVVRWQLLKGCPTFTEDQYFRDGERWQCVSFVAFVRRPNEDPPISLKTMVDFASEFVPIYDEVCQKVSAFLSGANDKRSPVVPPEKSIREDRQDVD